MTILMNLVENMVVVKAQAVRVPLTKDTQTIPLLRSPGFHQLKLINDGEGESLPSSVLGSDVSLKPIVIPSHVLEVVVAPQHQLTINQIIVRSSDLAEAKVDLIPPSPPTFNVVSQHPVNRSDQSLSI